MNFWLSMDPMPPEHVPQLLTVCDLNNLLDLEEKVSTVFQLHLVAVSSPNSR